MDTEPTTERRSESQAANCCSCPARLRPSLGNSRSSTLPQSRQSMAVACSCFLKWHSQRILHGQKLRRSCEEGNSKRTVGKDTVNSNWRREGRPLATCSDATRAAFGSPGIPLVFLKPLPVDEEPLL
jgi:hypothetical protein